MLKPRKETKHDLQRAKDLRVQDIQDLQKKKKNDLHWYPFYGKKLIFSSVKQLWCKARRVCGTFPAESFAAEKPVLRTQRAKKVLIEAERMREHYIFWNEKGYWNENVTGERNYYILMRAKFCAHLRAFEAPVRIQLRSFFGSGTYCIVKELPEGILLYDVHVQRFRFSVSMSSCSSRNLRFT